MGSNMKVLGTAGGRFIFLFLCFVSLEFASAQGLFKTVKCKNRAYPLCYMVPLVCPITCPYTCLVDCQLCLPVCQCNKPGAICNDPRFIGGDGITFYFHGKKDKDFCLVSDADLHINGHFIGKRGNGMKRDFTWVQSIGVLFDEHKLFIGTKKVAEWDDAVDQLEITFDGEPVFLPSKELSQWNASSSTLSITRSGPANEIVAELPNKFRVVAKVVPIGKEESRIHGYGITDEDCFAHLDLTFRFYSLGGKVNGVLGQTYADNYKSRAKIGAKMPVLGGVREFATTGLFATDCLASQFKGTRAVPLMLNSPSSHEDLECNGGVRGEGIVCKK